MIQTTKQQLQLIDQLLYECDLIKNELKISDEIKNAPSIKEGAFKENNSLL